MKFHEIPIGTRFELSGEIYAKTSPVIATREPDGKQKFMARSSTVSLVDTQGSLHSQPRPNRTLELNRVVSAFDAFCLRCHAEAEKLAKSEEELALFKRQLDDARHVFLDTL
jgi:hypothetical protein